MQVKIYKELTNFAPKVIGPFTLRQFAALLVCLPLGYISYTTLAPYVGSDMAGLSVVIPGVAAFLIGWTRPYGMTIEKFLGMYIRTRLLAPSKRKYIAHNPIVESIDDANAAWEREHRVPESDVKKKTKRGFFNKKKKAIPDGTIL